MNHQIHKKMILAGMAAVTALGLTACSPDDNGTDASSTGTSGGGTYTWWDPYPQHDDASAWAKRVQDCGTEAGVTIERTAYDTTALTNQALLAAQEVEVRKRAALRLGAMRALQAVPALERVAAGDPDVQVRRAAEAVLGDLGVGRPEQP